MNWFCDRMKTDLSKKDVVEGAEHASIILLSNVVKEKAMKNAMMSIESLDAVVGKITHIRVESLD